MGASRNSVSIVLSLLSIVACSEQAKEEIWRGTKTLDARHFSIVAPHPLTMSGPTTEICLALVATSYWVAYDSVSVDGAAGARPKAVLFDINGVADTISSWSVPVIGHRIPMRGPPGLSKQGDNLLCIFDQRSEKTHTPIARIEVWTDNPLAITRVLWWSGRRRAML
jgi:hypothetical protein